MKKKLFALLLCFAMIVSVSMPMALAATDDESTDPPAGTQAPTDTPATSITPELSTSPTADPTPSTTPAPETTPTPEPTLIEKLLACKNFADFAALFLNAAPEELSALTLEKLEQLKNKCGELVALEEAQKPSEENAEKLKETAAAIHEKLAALTEALQQAEADTVALAFYEQLMACESLEELENVLAGLAEYGMDVNTLLSAFTDGQRAAYEEHKAMLETLAAFIPPVDFTRVADFMPPVKGASLRRGFALDSEPDPTEALKLNKTAMANDDGSYTLTLEAYTTGTVTTTVTTVPTDIILVFDESGSMNGNFGNSNVKKKDALSTAALAFSAAVETKAKDNDMDHRIAVVGFSNQSSLYLNGTGISSPTTDQYKAALQDMSTAAGAANVNASINNLGTSGPASVNLGLDKANSIFDNNDVLPGQERNRVVIVFTGGSPHDYSSPIASARILKQTHGATVYTIGIFSGADGSNPASLPPGDQNDNRFMHLVSSNYPYASDMTSTGSVNPNLNGKSYYLTASDTSALNNVFEQISGQITTPSIELGEGTEIRDVIAPHFKLKEDAGQIKIYTAAANAGGTTFQDRVQVYPPESLSIITDENKTISVAGFDFDENFVSANPRYGNFYGEKLIIEIIVEPEAGFLGGNGVPTNGTESGIYAPPVGGGDPALIEAFPVPTVNVPIPAITVSAVDKNVYLTNTLSDAQLLNGATASAGITSLPLASGTPNTDFLSGDDAWKDDYVTLTTVVNRASGTASTPLMDDSAYTLTVMLTPETAGTIPAQSQTSASANIHVFKPELTFRDSTVWYGGDAPTSSAYEANNFVSTATAWKHGTSEYSTGVTMTGSLPTLTRTYTPDPSKISADNKIATKQDILVGVTVKIGGTGVTDNTSFVHQACTSTCAWASLSSSENPSSPAFLLHVSTCWLKLEKTGGAEGEPYVFNIKKDGGPNPYMTVSITGNGSKTICELPVGTYTVEEEGGWSWRYEGRYGVNLIGNASLGSTNPNATLTCTNEQKTGKNKWLNGYDLKINPPPVG